jgi:hypothetical protein
MGGAFPPAGRHQGTLSPGLSCWLWPAANRLASASGPGAGSAYATPQATIGWRMILAAPHPQAIRITHPLHDPTAVGSQVARLITQVRLPVRDRQPEGDRLKISNGGRYRLIDSPAAG